MLQFGKTALMYASEKGRATTVQALIGAGAGLNVHDQVRDRCFTFQSISFIVNAALRGSEKDTFSTGIYVVVCAAMWFLTVIAAPAVS
jgi:ankyrin repeat protein